MMDDVLLNVSSIGVSFQVDGGSIEAVRDVSFTLRKGQTIAIVGESGSGKSVTARAVMRLLSKRARLSESSRIDFDGRNMAELSDKELRKLRGNRISMIFQEPMSSLNPVYTVGQQIVEVLRVHQRISRADALRRAIVLLEEVQLPDPEARLNQYPHQLSGGQRQRVMIAMALANSPEILIADEPTTALDVTVQAEILNLVAALKDKTGMAVILITHDLTVVRRFADYVYVMQHGQIREEGPTERIFRHPSHPYTQRLVGSEPKGRANSEEVGSTDILTGKDIRVTYTLRRGGAFRGTYFDLHAVDCLSMALKRGETLGLVGESGSGKTTFGQALLRLNSLRGGEIDFLGNRIEHFDRKAMKPFRSRMQIVFQDPFSSLNPRMSVRQIIEEGLIVNNLCEDAQGREQRVRVALSEAGLPDTILNRFPHEFSGGQRQRLAIARAIALEPELILLDEPTSALDLSVQSQIIELLRKLQRKKGLSYLFISHDLKVVRALCHRVMVMQNGRIVEEGPVQQVLERPSTEYTRRLVNAAFEIAV